MLKSAKISGHQRLNHQATKTQSKNGVAAFGRKPDYSIC
jgi:hypothetical protein